MHFWTCDINGRHYFLLIKDIVGLVGLVCFFNAPKETLLWIAREQILAIFWYTNRCYICFVDVREGFSTINGIIHFYGWKCRLFLVEFGQANFSTGHFLDGPITFLEAFPHFYGFRVGSEHLQILSLRIKPADICDALRNFATIQII